MTWFYHFRGFYRFGQCYLWLTKTFHLVLQSFPCFPGKPETIDFFSLCTRTANFGYHVSVTLTMSKVTEKIIIVVLNSRTYFLPSLKNYENLIFSEHKRRMSEYDKIFQFYWCVQVINDMLLFKSNKTETSAFDYFVHFVHFVNICLFYPILTLLI